MSRPEQIWRSGAGVITAMGLGGEMRHWELFTALCDTGHDGVKRLWFWRRTEEHGVQVLSGCGFRALLDCVADARSNGLTDEPIEIVKSQK